MASEVKTNKISPSTSTTVTLGDASDLFQLPASAEIDIASGATLDVNGTIDLTGATTTGFPAGGLTTASQWRLTTDFTGDASPIASNLEEVDEPVGFGVLGSSMTESSGIFTFPSTGYWLITFAAEWTTSSSNLYLSAIIHTTTDNSTYVEASHGMTSMPTPAGTPNAGCTASYIMDVVSTSLCKCKFLIDIASATVTTKGSTAVNRTYMTFIKLGDT